LQNGQCSLAGSKKSYYLDETSPSECSYLIIDTDDEQYNNSGSKNVKGH